MHTCMCYDVRSTHVCRFCCIQTSQRTVFYDFEEEYDDLSVCELPKFLFVKMSTPCHDVYIHVQCAMYKILCVLCFEWKAFVVLVSGSICETYKLLAHEKHSAFVMITA